MNIHDQINEHFSDMAQEAKPIKLSDIEAEALRKALKDEAYSEQVMAANAHDKIQGAL
jgi:hypothetical protein